jgi:hypothetical protein
MIELAIRDGWVLVHPGTCVLVLSKGEFIRALKRGKSWRRADALAQRLAPRGQEEFPRPCRDEKESTRP